MQLHRAIRRLAPTFNRGTRPHCTISPPPPPRTTLRSIRASHAAGTPLTMLTAYDYPTARHADRAGVDIVLVGDSVGMVVLGNRTTQTVTTDEMVHHARAARRAVTSAMLIADMPFGSYETSSQQAVATAIRLVKEAAVDAVKLEGGLQRAAAIRAIVQAGVAVMGHVGLQPQSVSALGGFRSMGRSAREARVVLDDAHAVQQAGAFAMVVECVPERLASFVTEQMSIPTIGIGSGAHCDGQVLVYHDMLGILSHPHHDKVAPKFSKQYLELGPQIHDAISEYCDDVRKRRFPSARYSPYDISDEEFAKFVQQAHNQPRKRAATIKSPHAHSDDISLY